PGISPNAHARKPGPAGSSLAGHQATPGLDNKDETRARYMLRLLPRGTDRVAHCAVCDEPRLARPSPTRTDQGHVPTASSQPVRVITKENVPGGTGAP